MTLVDVNGRPLVRNLVLDVNGVLTASPLEVIHQLEDAKGIPRGKLVRVLVGDYERDTNHPWHRVERGEISFQRYIIEVAVVFYRQGFDVSPLELREVMHSPEAKRVDEEMIDLCYRAHAEGHNLALLTNGLLRYQERWQSVVPMHLFDDRVLDSSVIGLRKPARAFYKVADALWQFEPSQTVFIDDYKSNVDAAAATVGWHVIHHVDTRQTLDQIASMTGLDLTLPVQRWAPPEQVAAPSSQYRERVAVVRDRIEDLIAWRPETPIDPPLQPRGNAMRNSAPRAGLDRVVTGVRQTQERASSVVRERVDDVVSAGARVIAAGLDRLHDALKPEDTSTYAPGLGWQPLQLSVDDSTTVND